MEPVRQMGPHTPTQALPLPHLEGCANQQRATHKLYRTVSDLGRISAHFSAFRCITDIPHDPPRFRANP